MKSQIIAVCVLVFVTLPGQVTAQDWSSWTTSNNHDLQYRWSASPSGGNPTCQLQLRDLQVKVDTVVSVRIDYKFDNAGQSTRDVITITGPKSETLGERTVDHCVSVDEVHVNEAVRR